MCKFIPTLLSIAGSDPTGGAGIQADIRVGASMGLHVMSAITCVTAQNSNGVRDLGIVNDCLLQSQLSSIIEDVKPDGVKIGLIGDEANFRIISEFLKSLPDNIPVVVDPIIKASSDSSPLFRSDKIKDLYKNLIFPYASVITPNILEAEYFLQRKIDIDDLKFLQKDLISEAVIITGIKISDGIKDVLITKSYIETLSHPEIDCINLHGTGCVFSSFVTSYLILGFSLRDAFIKASDKMGNIIKRSLHYKLGSSSYGPLNINNYKL